jgi:hypothetical protein
VGLVPVTGQTLPLVSMGGSSIFFTSIATGMILSVSWGTKEIPAEAGESGEGSDEDVASGDPVLAADKLKDPTPKEVKEKANKRTEFEVNA